MFNVTMLMQYLLIAAVIGWVLNLPWMGPLRRAMDILANRGNSDLANAVRLSRLGEWASYESEGGIDTHKSTVGLKIVACFGATALLSMLAISLNMDGLLSDGGKPLLTLVALMTVCGIYLYYMLAYEVQISTEAMSIPTWYGGRLIVDHRKLIRIEDDGAYALRLYFEDGSRAQIMKHVTGRNALLARLTAEVNRNTRL